MFVNIFSESDQGLMRYGVDTNSETPRFAHSLLWHTFVKYIFFKIRSGVDENSVHVTIDLPL